MAYLRAALAREPANDVAWETAVTKTETTPVASEVALSAVPGMVSDELLHRGVVNVIGLEAVKARTGERWEKSRATAHSRLEAILQRKLGPSDCFIRLSDTAYLVSQPEVEREEARVCCLSIALELHAGLFGACDLGEIKIFAGLPAGGDAIALEAIEADEIAVLARKSGLMGSFGAPSATAPRPVMAAANASKLAPGHAFHALWDARKEAVIGYRCAPPASETAAENPAAVQLKARAEMKLVVAALGHASATIARHLGRGERFLTAIPMGYEALSCPLTRMEIAAACRDLPAELRPYLLFEIVDVPRGVPSSKLDELATTLKPFCKALIVHTPFRNRAAAVHGNTPIQAVALHLPSHRIGAAEARVEIERLRDEARRRGCMAMLTNVSDPEIFRIALACGVNLFSGPLIGRHLAPRPMHRLRVEDILAAAPAPSRAPMRRSA